MIQTEIFRQNQMPEGKSNSSTYLKSKAENLISNKSNQNTQFSNKSLISILFISFIYDRILSL